MGFRPVCNKDGALASQFAVSGCLSRWRCGSLELWRFVPNMPVESIAATAVTKELHAWESGGANSAEALTAWVGARLAAHEIALAALVAVEGKRTPENTLRLYDAVIEQL